MKKLMEKNKYWQAMQYAQIYDMGQKKLTWISFEGTIKVALAFCET
jgi:hypothetical protein